MLRMTDVTLLDGYQLILDHQGKLGHCDLYKQQLKQNMPDMK